MRVLQVDTGREMRGGQWQVLYLVREFPSLLMAREASPLYARAAAEGLEVRPLSAASLARLSRAVDLVHAHDARAHAYAALLAHAPLVVSRRVAFAVREGPASRWKYARAAHCLAVSEFVKRRLEAADVPGEKISVVYDGVPLREPGGGTRIIAPAFDDPKKGTALVEEAARLAGVEVEFSRNLDEDLGGAGLFVYITHEEGLGSAALLAMAAGVPVIASRVGGLSEAIEDGVSGLLTENEPGAIAKAMRRLLDDSSLAREMAARARQRVEERFSVRRMVEGTVEAYRKVLSC